MQNNINEKVERDISAKLHELFQQAKLIIRKDGKIIEVKSIKEIQILNCKKLTSPKWEFNGSCKLKTGINGDEIEDIWRLSGNAIIFQKLNEEQEVQIEKIEIVDDTITVSKYFS